MDHTVLIILAAVVAALLLVVLLLRSRRQRVTFGDAAAVLPPAERRATTPAAVTPPATPVSPPPVEGHDVSSEIAAAVEDVVDQFVGLDAHPSGVPTGSAGDTLTTLKGLGPKAAARLQELGVTRFEQIAAWDHTDVEAIDAQMGAFRGRIVRDRWVEQARLLAAGDRDTFEQQFGKLGS